MANYNSSIDRVFHALADSTRREVMRQLTSGPATVKGLAEPHEMALPSFMKHIRVLEECELISTHKTGRVRSCALRPDTLSSAEQWLADTQAFWEQRLGALGSHLEEKNSATDNSANASGGSNDDV